MESVNILLRAYQIEHLLLIKVRWKRQLNEDATNFGVKLHLTDLLHQFRHLCRSWQFEPVVADSNFVTSLDLQFYILVGLRQVTNDYVAEHGF